MLRRCAAVLAVLALASALAGCGRLIGQPYDNFTAYYNTFYNARQEFGRAETELMRVDRPVDRARYLSVFYEPAPAQSAGEGFQKAVEKGADLLRDHPDSKWVDDALLLIGKAYFYQANYAGAEQKFREVLALDQEALKDEAYLWLGRTLLAAGQYADATTALREGIDYEGSDERWRAAMRLVLGEVAVREGDLGAAVEALQQGLETVRDRDAAARAAFLLGQVYEALGRPDAAAGAFGRVLDFNPRYELAYAAQLSRGLALGLSGRSEEALDLLRRMSRDDKNIDRLAAIELARARVLAASGRPEAGRDALTRLLYDRNATTRVGDQRGRVHYYLAEIYREGLGDFVRAAVHYDTAATALGQQAAADLRASADAILDAPTRAQTFGSFARIATQIAEMDSLLYLGSLDDEAFQEAIAEIRAQRQREREEAERQLQRQRDRQGFGGISFEDGSGGQPTPPPGPGGTEDAGFLGFRNPIRVQESLVAFQTRWGDRPLVPNWRRAAAIGGATEVEEGLADEMREADVVQTPGFVQDDLVDITAVPRDPLTRQRMLEARALARYELGNTLFLSIGMPDSAAVWYRLVIEEDAESPVAPRAYFALAETHLALGNEAEAERLFRQLTERYPDSEFTDRALARLGQAPAEVAAPDSLQLAGEAYAAAFRRWQAGQLREAFQAMLDVNEAYAETEAAARARLAAARIYTEWARGDTTALLALGPGRLLGEVPGPDLPGAPDTLAQAAPPSAVLPEAAPPTDPAPTQSGGPVEPEQGGFTWVVRSSPEPEDAVALAERFLAEGQRAGVLVAELDGAPRYRVGLGQYRTQAEATAARADLPPDVADEAWLLALAGSEALPIAAPPAEEETAPAEEDVAEVDAPASDSLAIVTDPLAIVSDSLAAVSDSLALIEPIGADSAGVALPEPQREVPWLEALYASVETDFPDTPYAERARMLREALETLRVEPEPMPVVADSTAAPLDDFDFDDLGPASLRGEAAIEPAAGGFTWLIFASTSREEAADVLEAVTAQRFRAAAYEEEVDGQTEYRIVVGQFGTEAEANGSAGALPPEARPDQRRVLALDEAGFLQTAEQLRAAPEN